MEEEISKEMLSKKIAGEIVLSDEPGKTIQKWRNIFKIPQRTLANEMKMMPSVISDYENGRRKSPGIKIIKRIVDSMVKLDEKAGGKIIREFSAVPNKRALSDAIISVKELNKAILVKDFCRKMGADLIGNKEFGDNKLYGYTIVDAAKAVVELSPTELVRLYGLTNNKALILKGAHSGKSSMIGLKVANVKPGLVIFQTKEKDIDVLAKRIAQIEGIPIAKTSASLNELKTSLKRFYK